MIAGTAEPGKLPELLGRKDSQQALAKEVESAPAHPDRITERREKTARCTLEP